MLKTSGCVTAVFGFDVWGPSGRRAKKMRGGKLRHSVLEMYFLLGERCAENNGGKLLCVLSVLRHL